MMPGECCNSDPWKTLSNFLREMKWVNEDYPQANRALVEGLRSGFIGYETDSIIHRVTRKLPQTSQAPLEDHQGGASVNSSKEIEQFNILNEKHLKELEELLRGSSPVHFNASPRKGQSSLSIRPTPIGEERRKWLATTKPMDFQEFQHKLSKSESCVPKDGSRDQFSLNTTTSSCPDFHASQTNSFDFSKTNEPEPSNAHLYKDDSCTCIFKSREAARVNSNKFRLSPRMEKFDKLIPKTSKEFIDTFRIVNTITPHSSEEELQLKLGKFNKHYSDETISCNCDSNVPTVTEVEATGVEMNNDVKVPDMPSQRKSMGRSYKEACLFGHPSSSTARDRAKLLATNQPHVGKASPRFRSDKPQPVASFPSLEKLHSDGEHSVGQAHPKNFPPLYSTILSKGPTKHNQSPTSSFGPYDCGFCRTNKAPEYVYRSHPLRSNDVVVCPALRKFVCCFCGATGDTAHTIKYCPINPIGFYAQKGQGRQCPLTPPSTTPEKDKTPRRTPIKSDKKINKSFTLKSKTETKGVVATEEAKGIQPSKRLSEDWITPKTKGRRRK